MKLQMKIHETFMILTTNNIIMNSDRKENDDLELGTKHTNNDTYNNNDDLDHT